MGPVSTSTGDLGMDDELRNPLITKVPASLSELVDLTEIELALSSAQSESSRTEIKRACVINTTPLLSLSI